MRMGAFMLGGIVGAAAVIYFNRNNSWSFAGLANSLSGSMSGSKMNHNDHRSSRSSTASTTSSSSSSRDDSGFKEMEKMIQSDPAVKHEVDQILNQSEKSYITQ